MRHEYKVQVELSDTHNLLFLITLGDGEDEVRALASALRALAATRKSCGAGPAVAQQAELPPLPETVLLPREAIFAPARTVPLAAAEGLICGEIINFYPPGIPIICPGERIDGKTIAHCQSLQASGMHLSGAADNTLQTIRVIDERVGK